ncbi:hypothetical protein ES319_A02G151700v1 [Gossypium barbadense]|uniref:Uncharacterized protein n=1 Tax=Gossypium barbadense TaxID=3634 RepID=A0A5J5WRC5_GOSBA|nr:hypothetical protein ES319_A02G151700v1 [Gossypium barbadense]
MCMENEKMMRNEAPSLFGDGFKFMEAWVCDVKHPKVRETYNILPAS